MDFLSKYLAYTDKTECPVIYSRWSAIVGVAALLGRNAWVSRGHFNIYPNLFSLLIGTAGARKGTSIKIMKKLMMAAGYYKFSPNKVKAETFLKILSEDSIVSTPSVDDFLFQTTTSNGDISECFVAIDEFMNFIGQGNLDFMSILGELWDHEGRYENPLATKKSVYIENPTVSILGGMTPTNVHLCFPVQAIGQGFFSRLLFIYSDPRRVRYHDPPQPTESDTRFLIQELMRFRETKFGELTFTKEAKALAKKIYEANLGVDDIRFDAYNSRRDTQLLKLCIVVFVTDMTRPTQITEKHVRYANTILTHAERYMPKALGEFGRAKNSDVGHKLVQLVNGASRVLTIRELWEHVYQDLEKMSLLGELLNNLVNAGKIQMVPGKGFLAKREIIPQLDDELVDFTMLTQEEREMPV